MAHEPALLKTKATLSAAWLETTSVRMPAHLQASLAAAETLEALRQVMNLLMEVLGDDGAAFFELYQEFSQSSVIGEEGEGFVYEKDDEGNFVNKLTGDILDTEQIQAALGVDNEEGLLSSIIGGAPGEDPGALLDLPFIGGRPGPGTVPEDQPLFEPPGVPLDDPDNVGITNQLLRGAEPGITGLPQRIRNAQLLQPVQRYHLGFDWSPASWDQQRRIILKDSLVRAGFLDPDQMTGGATWAFPEASAMALLADESNGAGIPWNIQLAKVAANPSEAAKRRAKGRAGADRRPFVAPAFLAPDMDTLTQAVKGSVRQRLGREPTAKEMGELIATLDTDYSAEFGVQVAALRSEFDATTRAIDTDEPQAAGSFRSVDPSARFAEHFDKRFAGEIDVRKRGAAVNQREAISAATMSMVDGLIGGRQ